MKPVALLAACLTLIAASDPATETVHVVQDGETLGGVANRTGVDKAIIIAANGLAEPYYIEKGQHLVIPRQRSHIVTAGQSASAIAQKYGIPLANLAIANGLSSPDYPVRAGQKLIIPALVNASTPPQTPRELPYFKRPHDGEIIMGYAKRADGHGHDGLDFAARPGDMVRASASGTVIYAGIHRARFGNLVVIEHRNGYRTAYGHLARVTVQQGDWVKLGERVGIAGNTGQASGYEVHFEIRKDNKRIDPAPLLDHR